MLFWTFIVSYGALYSKNVLNSEKLYALGIKYNFQKFQKFEIFFFVLFWFFFCRQKDVFFYTYTQNNNNKKKKKKKKKKKNIFLLNSNSSIVLKTDFRYVH